MSSLVKKICCTNQLRKSDVFEQKGCVYTFLNPVSYLDALKNIELFDQFDGLFADGGILVKSILLWYGKAVKRCSFDMTSLAKDLFEYASVQKKTIYIVASKPEEVAESVRIIKEQYPDLQIIGYRSGYFNSEQEKDTTASDICALNPDFLIVGMGALNQEKFLLKVKNSGYKGIGFTCGGFIHQTAKRKIKYYPTWINKLGLRFLYRMWKEPHTRKRYFKAGFLFPIAFIKDKISNN